MTCVLILLVGIFTILQNSQALNIQTEDKDLLRKQEVIFQLLWHTKDTPKNHPEVFERVKNYKIEDVAAACANKTFAKEFEAHLKRGMIPRDQIFSSFHDEHIEEIRTIFNVFHNAKNFDDFASMAAWSSLVVNELSWLYAFTIAIAHRSDTKFIRLPRLYEILPHYFFNTDIVMRAYRIKTGEVAGISNQYTIEANYTDQHPAESDDAEYKLSYFREDVGLNEFYFHFSSNFPFWMSSNELPLQKSIRGELYYQVHKMLLARYKLERLSMGLINEIEDIDWDQPILTGFHSSMTHFNGLPFPQRLANSHVPVFKYKYLEEAKHLESRVSRAIDLGELRTTDASIRMYDPKTTTFNDFCNVLEGNADSSNPKFYGSLDRIYRRLLGFASEYTNKRRYTPSALETSFTSLRDPGFYRMCKRIVDYGIRFKRNLPAYSEEELRFEGVRIDYVHLDHLVTYLSPFESILNHPRVLQLDESSSSPIGTPRINVKVRQFRLDHKPFNYEIGVSSEHEGKAIIRIFLGPKLDPRGNQIGLEDSLDDLYELDRWVVELKQGSTKLERSSSDSVYVATSESLQSSEFYNRQVSRALSSDSNLARELVSRALNRRAGLPPHLLLPRGSKAGLALRFIVCLHPIQRNLQQQLDPNYIFGTVPMDDRALGFPFDRPLDANSSLEMARNFLVKDVRVYHEDVRTDSEGNIS